MSFFFSETELSARKQEARKRALATRRARASLLLRQGASARIAHHLERWSAHYAGMARVGVYIALPGELSCGPIMQGVMREGGRVFAPRMSTTGAYDFDLIEVHRHAVLRAGRWGVREPEGEPIFCALPDLILVPGLAFDRFGGRLGFGKGYYDRFLARVRASERPPIVMGVCDEALLTRGRLPTGRRDERMDGVLTQCGLICWNARGTGEGVARLLRENHSPRLDIPGNEADKREAQRSREPERMEEVHSYTGCSRRSGLLDT